METLKIALVELSTAELAGGFVALCNLSQALAKRGHDVHVIMGTKDRGKWQNQGIETRLEEVRSCAQLHLFPSYDNVLEVPGRLDSTKKVLSNLHRTYGFDIVHCQGLSGLFTPDKLLDRLVVTLHGNSIYRGIVLTKYACKNMSIPHVADGLAGDAIGSVLRWSLEKEACRKAKKVILLTYNEARLAEHYYSLNEAKMRIVPNPVLLPRGDKTCDLHLPNHHKAILTVSSLSLIKGIPLLARAAENILSWRRHISYIFVGTGPLEGIVRRLMSKFPGRVLIFPQASDKMRSIYSQSTLLVHGSLYESQGLVIAEAMLSGKPVVAFNTSAIPECVLDNVTGLLAKPFDHTDLARKTITLLEDENVSKEMGSIGKERVEKLYGSSRIAERVESVYREALSS